MKIKGLRWYIATLLMIVTTINYIDRSALSVAAPVLKKELSITVQEYTYIIMAFQFTYLVMQAVGGRIIDWLNLRKGFVIAVVWWTIAKMLHALASTPFSFGVVRALLGIGEAANFPAVAKTNAEWFPPKERTIATGLANVGSGTGALLATPLVAWIIMRWDWQTAFVATGILGFAWAAVWWVFYRPPEQHPWITPEELDHIQKGQAELKVEDHPHEKGVWAKVIGQKNFWAIGLTRFLSEPAWQFFTYFIPIYLMEERGMNIKEIALFAWLPFLGGDLGSLVGGFLSPLFQKMGCRILTARKASMTTAAFMMPFALFIATAPSAYWVIVWFTIAAFGHQCISSIMLTLPADLFPKRMVATANGMSGTMAHLGGMTFTFAVGWLVAHLGYKPIFVIIGFLDIIGAAILWTMMREPKMAAETSSESGAL